MTDLPEAAVIAGPVNEELRQSEERFRLLVQGVREYAIFMLDPHGYVISWNPGAHRIKGYSSDEIIGRHFSTFYTPEAIASEHPAHELEVAIAEGFVEDEGWRVRRDGTQFWASVVITTLRDAAGRHVGFAKVTRDLTDRRNQEETRQRLARARLRESEVRFASFAQHLPGLAWIKDRLGRYAYLNEAAAQMLGRPADEIIGHTDCEIFPGETATLFRANDLLVLESRRGQETVEELRAADGSIRHSIVSRFPIADADGEVDLIGGIAIDITERVNAEQALLQADRRKNEFLATLSHELRNPLAPIRTGVHLLRNNADPDTQGRVYQMLEQQMEHLVRLVDDLLELSRISSGKIELRLAAVDLREVSRAAVDAASALLVQKGHDLEVTLPDTPVWVSGDRVRLVQVVANLLNNAAKYTPDRGRVRLAVESTGTDAVIRVADNGAGIPADMVPRVFDMFTQINRTLDRSQGGLGIGLALARSIVDLHGGRLDAFSGGLDRGSEFVARFALAAPDVLQPGQSAPAAPQAALTRVLVVDDNHDAADSLVMMLGVLSFDARGAYDGRDALTVAGAWRPDVVLLDIGMPGMDGYEVARRMRAENPEGARLIALTGWGTIEDRARSRDAGFDEHWVKPVDPAKLQGLLAVRPSAAD